MADPDFVLYHSPGACSQVTVCALEMAGLPYRLELINVMAGEQHSAEYLAISPHGKVPYAVIDGKGLNENIAIISFIAELRPESGIFPVITSARDRAEIISGLSFCSGTLHPQVRGIFAPQRYTDGETAGVKQKSMELGKKSYKYANQRLAERGWWLGVPSIIDVYLNWTASVATKGGFAQFPHIQALPERLKQLPAFVAMLKEEANSAAQLAR
jgi:glutathione S-transferase